MYVTTAGNKLAMMAASVVERDWLRAQADASYDNGGLYRVEPAIGMEFKARGEAAGIVFAPFSAIPKNNNVRMGLELESDRTVAK